MTVLTRWDPFREFSTMQDRMNRMNRLFRESYSPEGPEEALTTTSFAPPVDIYEDEHTITLKLEVPGIEEKDIDVRIENNTKKPYDAKGVLIGAKYGDDNDAQIIIDKTNELQSGFKGKIKPKDEDVATVGFAVPWKELNKVTFIVDPNDDVHEVICFTGRVHRA